jgi:nitrous oxidase accessory protein
VGKDQPVTSLTKAIQIAKDKDTILLRPGVYTEGTITITKAITLIGINYPVLDGESKDEILLVSGHDIRIIGLCLKNSRYSSSNDYAAVDIVNATRIWVENNKIINAHFGIHGNNSSHCIIRNNYILGTPRSEQVSGNGIHFWKSNHILIENNHIQGHRDGIYFEFVTDSDIKGNISENNIRYGLHFMFSHRDNYVNNIFRNNGAGVAVMYTHNVRMEGNTFEKNWGNASYAILLKEISDSYIIHNNFTSNTIGIDLEGTSRMDVEKNIFKENGWAIKITASCSDNNIHHNKHI